MSVDYHSLVRAILNEVREGLGPYIVEIFAEHFGRERNAHLKSLKRALSSDPAYRSKDFDSDEDVIGGIDIAGWLKIMRLRWDPVFKEKLGEDVESKDINVLNARAYVRELIEGRNKWGHETERNEIKINDVVRIAGNARRLLGAISAETQSESVRKIADEIFREMHSSESVSDDDADRILNRVDLSSFDLIRRDLKNRHLKYAVLQDADLSESILDGEDLRGCNMTRAKFRKASLVRAKLSDTDLSHADLTGADLSNPEWLVGDSILYCGDRFDDLWLNVACWNVDLSNALLENANMRRAFFVAPNLKGANLTGANLRGARIESAELSGTTFDSTDLSQCDLLGCDFTGVSLRGARLVGSSLIEVRFSNADLSGADLTYITNRIDDDDEALEFQWVNVNLSNAILSDAKLSKIVAINANLTEATLINTDLRHADLFGADLTRTMFHNSDLTSANLRNTILTGTDFTNADLSCVELTGANFAPLSTILPDGTYWDADTDMTKFTGSPADN